MSLLHSFGKEWRWRGGLGFWGSEFVVARLWHRRYPLVLLVTTTGRHRNDRSFFAALRLQTCRWGRLVLAGFGIEVF